MSFDMRSCLSQNEKRYKKAIIIMLIVEQIRTGYELGLFRP